MAGRSSRSEFRSGSDDIRGATSDSDLEPRSAASEDPSSETHELDEEQSKDVLSRAIQRNFPDVKNEIRVTATGDFLKTVDYGVYVFQHQGKTSVVLRGLGSAIQRTVDIGNAIKRRIPLLTMAANIGSTPVKRNSETRVARPLVSFISVLLSVDAALPPPKVRHGRSRKGEWGTRVAKEHKKHDDLLPKEDCQSLERTTLYESTSTESSRESSNHGASQLSSRREKSTGLKKKAVPTITAIDPNALVDATALIRGGRPRSASVPRPERGRFSKTRGGYVSKSHSHSHKKSARHTARRPQDV